MTALKGAAFPVGFGRAALLLAAASSFPCSGHLSMSAELGGAPCLLSRAAAAASRTGALKAAALPTGSERGPLSSDGDLEPSLGVHSEQLLKEVKGIHIMLQELSRVQQETASFKNTFKRILLQITVTLLLTSVALLLIFKMAKAMGYTDIDRYLKDAFISFISDKDVRANVQEAINSHLDATFEYIVPWNKFKMWWWRNLGWFLSRKV